MMTAFKNAVAAIALIAAAGVAVAEVPESYPASPAQALERLKAGNVRFVEGESLDHDYLAGVKATAGGQKPFAAIVSCLDSRVPPEIVFDQGIGDVFVGRIAGNFVDTEMLGSLEFATGVVGAQLIVVLGHTDCGAVKGACDGVQLDNLTATLSNISPAVYAVQGFENARTSKNGEFVNAVTHANVDLNVKSITDRSRLIAGLVEQGKVRIVGAVYDVATGKVTFRE